MLQLIADQPERLDKFLARTLSAHSRSKLVRLIEEGLVLVDGRLERSSYKLEPGMTVALEEPEESAPHDLTPADIALDVVYEDDVMLVVNKPRGLATHPAPSLKEPSLVNALLARGSELSSTAGAFRPGIVHRLDKDTTGLLMIAKTDAAHVDLAAQIEERSAGRRYFAVVAGHVEQELFTIDAPMARDIRNRLKMTVDPKGKPAVTHVKLVKRLEAGTLVALRLETGRTHQIRVHLRAVALPVLGDTLYAPREYASHPLQLHAALLAVRHPITGEAMTFYATPPPDFIGAEWADEEAIRAF